VLASTPFTLSTLLNGLVFFLPAKAEVLAGKSGGRHTAMHGSNGGDLENIGSRFWTLILNTLVMIHEAVLLKYGEGVQPGG
jgi:hypothetical protein